jgi:drug/metabolite transporter (DMT)-like permease
VLLPGADAPDLIGAGLMLLAGFGWAGFSILGLKNSTPALSMLQSFTLAVPFAVLVSFAFRSSFHITSIGVLLAVLSGALTSALGYWAWYALLPKLTAISAAVLQLTVPIIVAVIGVLFLQETLSLNFYVATTFVVAGLLLYRFNLSNK